MAWQSHDGEVLGQSRFPQVFCKTPLRSHLSGATRQLPFTGEPLHNSRPYGLGALLQRLCHLFGSHEDGVDVLLLMRRGEEHGLKLAGRGIDPVL